MTVCHILREDPELAEAISAADRPRALEECIARTVRLPIGRWSPGGPAGRHGTESASWCSKAC